MEQLKQHREQQQKEQIIISLQAGQLIMLREGHTIILFYYEWVALALDLFLFLLWMLTINIVLPIRLTQLSSNDSFCIPTCANVVIRPCFKPTSVAT